MSFDTSGWRKLFRELIGAIGATLNERATRGADVRDAGVWLTDEHDRQDIGDPVGNIAVRRLELKQWKNIEDAEDIAALVPAVGAYVMANWRKLNEVWRQRHRNRQAEHARVADDQNGATS